MTELPKDGDLDRATDPEYAAVSTMAVIGLVAGVLGLAAVLAAPLVALPLAGFILSVMARRKIRRSEGVLTGLGITTAGILLGAAVTLAASAYHGYTSYGQHRILSDLEGRAYAVTDDLLAGRYDKVYERMPEDFRRQQAAGAQEFRSRFLPLFEGAGDFVQRSLMNLQRVPTDKGEVVAPAEVRVDFQRRSLDLTVWFRQKPQGDWELVGVGGQETFESQVKFPSEKPPVIVPGPYQRAHGHEH